MAYSWRLGASPAVAGGVVALGTTSTEFAQAVPHALSADLSMRDPMCPNVAPSVLVDGRSHENYSFLRGERACGFNN